MFTALDKKFFVKIVFASVLFSAAIIVADELTTTIQNPIGVISWLRVPLGIYLGLFPVGFLALAFLFPFEEMDSIERFGLSIAVSISINVISILLANIFLSFPITLTRNLIIIVFWSIAFFALFLFRTSIVPVAVEFWEQYDWEFAESQKRFAWLKLFDIVLFSSLLAGLVLIVGVITKHGQAFNGISNALSPFALIFLLLFPSGYFVLYAFFSRVERSALANLLLIVLFSIPVHILSALILFTLSITTRTSFSFTKLLLVSVFFNILLYSFIFFSERIMPIAYYWLDRRQRAWK